MNPPENRPLDSSFTRPRLDRRHFIGRSIAATVAAPLALSLEERRLVAHAASEPGQAQSSPPARMPCGRIGSVEISRLICGGNLISGYAHSRYLIYVSDLLKHYFVDERIMETWALCEAHGINTMVASSTDPHAYEVYRKYRARGGKMQFLAQVSPAKTDLKTPVMQAVDAGAVGAFLVGNLGDLWTRERSIDLVGDVVQLIRSQGMIAGVAGHELRTLKEVEKAGIAPDFHVKTLHDNNYWSRRQPGQDKEVIDNYTADNYWCLDPVETIRFMSELERPWIAYKILAAGAIHPKAGFRHAFGNGADFALVGMFDFQVATDAAIACEAVSESRNRNRAWMA